MLGRLGIYATGVLRVKGKRRGGATKLKGLNRVTGKEEETGKNRNAKTSRFMGEGPRPASAGSRKRILGLL